jgi:hypothetical protein
VRNRAWIGAIIVVAGGALLLTWALGTFDPGEDRTPSVISVKISLTDDPDVERWVPLLPRLSGTGSGEPVRRDTHQRIIRFFVDASGALRRDLVDIAREKQLETLIDHADWQRDLGNPANQSTVQNFLFLDRDMAGRAFRELLLLLTAREVRMRWVYLVARYEDTPEYLGLDPTCLSLDLRPVAYLTEVRIRMQETAMNLVVREVGEAVQGTDLAEAVSALPEETRKKGVLLRFGPRVRVERLMRVLHVLTQQEDLRVVLDIRKEAVPETRWGLELDGEPVRLVDPTGRVKTDIKLEVWR